MSDQECEVRALRRSFLIWMSAGLLLLFALQALPIIVAPIG
jgi:hypothetical protein